MGRYLGIDYGTKRTGVAVSDPTGLIATPLDTVMTHNLMNYLSDYMSGEPVDKLIVGRPVRLDSRPSGSFKYVQQFVSAFRKKFPGVKVEWMDERFTSKIAMNSMIDGGVKKKMRQNRDTVDRISALLILQSYLDRENNPA